MPDTAATTIGRLRSTRMRSSVVQGQRPPTPNRGAPVCGGPSTLSPKCLTFPLTGPPASGVLRRGRNQPAPLPANQSQGTLWVAEPGGSGRRSDAGRHGLADRRRLPVSWESGKAFRARRWRLWPLRRRAQRGIRSDVATLARAWRRVTRTDPARSRYQDLVLACNRARSPRARPSVAKADARSTGGGVGRRGDRLRARRLLIRDDPPPAEDQDPVEQRRERRVIEGADHRALAVGFQQRLSTVVAAPRWRSRVGAWATRIRTWRSTAAASISFWRCCGVSWLPPIPTV